MASTATVLVAPAVLSSMLARRGRFGAGQTGAEGWCLMRISRAWRHFRPCSRFWSNGGEPSVGLWPIQTAILSFPPPAMSKLTLVGGQVVWASAPPPVSTAETRRAAPNSRRS